MKPTYIVLTLTCLLAPSVSLQLQHPLPQHDHNTMASMADKPSGPPLLADILPLDKAISIFSGFTRSISSISDLLSDRAQNTTVIAPSNVAISRLPRKPWEDPDDGGAGGNVFSDVYKGILGEDRATRNLRRFVEAHCVGVSPWEKGQKVKTVEGTEIWWEEKDGKKWIMPQEIEISQMKDQVANGELWIIDGVVNYDR